MDESEALVSAMTEIQSTAQQWPDRTRPIIRRVHYLLRSIEKGDQYFNPEVVAIGPYHRHDPQVQPAEAIKKAVALDFCKSSRRSVREFYKVVRDVTPLARLCYADRFDDISDKEFADMMFFDGCFLLQFIVTATGYIPASLSVERWMSSFNLDRVFRDVMLLENQLPWVVLEALMSFRWVPIDLFLQKIVAKIDMTAGLLPPYDEGGSHRDNDRSPCHLLELVREKFLGPQVQRGDDIVTHISIFTSAIDLAEVGVRICASDTFRFRNFSFRRGPLYGWLSLPPIVLTTYNRIVLSNLVAFEMCPGVASESSVGSYLSLLVALISREEDVKELRSKKILYGGLSDQQSLSFFKSLSPYLMTGNDYMSLLQHLNDYHRRRKVRVFIHKIVYNNFNFLLAATSVVLFLITILQTIFTIYPRK
nr:unnamed protein product [Ananas comosus var. bracteatus]